MDTELLRTTLRNYLATVVVAVAVLAVLVGAWAFAGQPAAPGQGALVVRVHDGDGGVRELPLHEDGELLVQTSLGSNTVVVANGAARVADADCPGLDCTRQAPISQPGQQLICMPHRLWVEVVEQGAKDGEMDVSAVLDHGQADLVSR